MEAGYIRRLTAYLLDVFLLFVFSSFLLIFFPLPEGIENYKNDLNKKTVELVENKISVNDFKKEMQDITYNIDHTMVGFNILNVLIYILYFLVFQYYNKGQTLGKKIMKIKIVKDDNSLSINDLALRGLLINSVFINMLLLMLVLLLDKTIYFLFYNLFNSINILFLLITSFFVLYRKDKKGLHDLIVKTKVVFDNK